MAAKLKETYTRNATVKRVVDGDTVHLDLDLGCNVHLDVSCRLNGVDAPELKTAAGKAAKAWLDKRLPVGQAVTVQTIKGEETEKYGRYLAEVYKDDKLSSVNQQMLAEGIASPYNGGRKSA